jgi:hypothetical protein
MFAKSSRRLCSFDGDLVVTDCRDAYLVRQHHHLHKWHSALMLNAT